jgi:hypothetical protein
VLRPAAPVETYVFFCQHLTPELVWPREPRDHPNGAFRIRAVHVAGPSADDARRGFEALLGAGGGSEPAMTYDSAKSPRERSSAPSAAAGRPYLSSLELQVRDLERCEAHLAQQGVAFQRAANAIHCHDEFLGHTIVFSA